MTVGGGGGISDDRRLVEHAVTMLLGDVPAGWTTLHAEFEAAAAAPPAATASVTCADGELRTLAVPAGAVEALNEYRRLAAAGGAEWQRLVIDCDPDGRLAVRTDPPADVRPRGPRRWPQRVLAVVTVGCLIAAALVFALAWRWSPPPRAAMIEVPPPSPRQQEAFEVVTRFYDAERRGDWPALRALVCAHPGKNVEDEIEPFQEKPDDEGISYLEAVAAFRDDGDRVWGRFVFRVHPLSEVEKRVVEQAQAAGTGLFADEYTLVQEGGSLKICDADEPPWQ
jgi:hypothetical protein